MKIHISQIVRDPEIQIRDGLDPETVARYTATLNELPPVTVVRTSDGDLLADGFHRLDAAIARGRKTIDADVRDGTRVDALELAIGLNTAHGKPLTASERKRAILRLLDLDKPMREIGRIMGVSDETVRNIAHQRDIEAEVGRPVTIRDAREIKKVDPEFREPLSRLNAQDVKEVAKALADPDVPREHKVAAIRQIANHDGNGRLALDGTLIAATLREGRRFTALPQVLAFTGAAHGLLDHLANDRDPFRHSSGSDLRRINDGIDAAEQAIVKVRALLAQKEVTA